ncbi:MULTISPECIES: hypothetical protein [unclassified Polaribacter]|uniref:hypothetical protein n=1 Tax=unclassified Polaribacter TaxID=196858 RepID=UPI001CB890D8|nr:MULTISPECIES: hypothetical protein [unclassified Polaribacter]
MVQFSASYIFGTDESYQIVSTSFANFTLKRASNLAIRFRQNVNFIIAQQSFFFSKTIRTPNGPEFIEFTQNVFDLLNTQISFPISITTNSWDFEVGYNLNLPNAVGKETNLNTTGFVNLSAGYMFDLSTNK